MKPYLDSLQLLTQCVHLARRGVQLEHQLLHLGGVVSLYEAQLLGVPSLAMHNPSLQQLLPMPDLFWGIGVLGQLVLRSFRCTGSSPAS